MKRFLCLALLLPLLAAAKTPDENDIFAKITDTASPYYYTGLMMRYNEGDSTLTDEDYHYLYYGYAYQDSYKPLEPIPDMDRLLLLASGLDPENPRQDEAEAIVSAGTDVLARDPFNPKVLNLMAYAYGALGDRVREKAYFDRMNRVLRTILSSGDGLTEKTPRHILMFDHALDALSAEGLAYEKSRIVSRSVEFVPLTTPFEVNGKKRRGYYFDYSRIYRNKPEGYTFKRERTWQFNNLKPREYK